MKLSTPRHPFACLKRLLPLALAALGLAAPLAARGQFEYAESGGQVTLTRYVGSDAEVIAPATVNGLPVVAVGPSFCRGNAAVVGAVLGGGIRTIGASAFSGCSNLARVVLGNAVQTIEARAFEQCAGLKGLDFPPGLLAVGDSAFFRCGALERVALPDGVRTIGAYAFYGCGALADVWIGNGISSIGLAAFSECNQLNRAVVGTGLASVGEGAFYRATNLVAVYFFGAAPQFGDSFHSVAGSKPFTIYHRAGQPGWPASLQGHAVVPFERLPTLRVSPTWQEVTHLASSGAYVDVANDGTGRMAYEAKASGIGFSISGTSNGVDAGRVYLLVQANNASFARTGTLVVSSIDATNGPLVATIVQPARPSLQVRPTQMNVGHLASQTNLAVTNARVGHSMGYAAEVVAGGGWLSIPQGATGTTAGLVVLDVAATTSPNVRTGLVRVSAPGALFDPMTIAVRQPGQPILSAEPDLRAVSHVAGTTDVVVADGNGGWSMGYAIGSDSGWVRFLGGATGLVEGADSATVRVAYAANRGLQPRTARLEVAAPGAVGSPRILQLVQDGQPPLAVSPVRASVGSGAGQVAFAVSNAYGPYSASTTAAWMRVVSGATGDGGGTVVVAYDANPYAPARLGELVVVASDASGGSPFVVHVQQGEDLILEPGAGFYAGGPARRASFAVFSATPWTASTTHEWIELLCTNSSAGSAAVYFNVASNGGGARSGSIEVSNATRTESFVAHQWPAPSALDYAEPGDFDGDGRADPAAYDPAGGRWEVAFADGLRWQIPMGGPGRLPVPADYDGDGLADFAVFNPADNRWTILHSASATLSEKTFPGYAITNAVPAPGDYEGAGRANLAIFDPADRKFRILYGIGNTIASEAFPGGAVPVPADYLGNGRADSAVYEPADGRWIVQGILVAPDPLGGPGYLPVPGDYDGDGKSDYAIFRAGQWTLRQAAGGAIVSNTFGDPDGVPVPGDYDGDGKTDLATSHSSNGSWRILSSETGETNVHSLGGAGWIPALTYVAKGRIRRDPQWRAPIERYDDWKDAQFTPTQAANPAISGPEADPDGTGVQNLLRYALGLGSADDPADALPVGLPAADGREPLFRLRRLLAQDAGIEYVVEGTDALELPGPWSPALDLVPLPPQSAGDGRTEFIDYRVPLQNGQARYLRLRVRILDESTGP
jgi:hypothetical protein